MARFSSTEEKLIGLSPYAAYYHGDKGQGQTKIRLISYNDSTHNTYASDHIQNIKSNINGDARNWLNIDGINNLEILNEIFEELDLEPLILSDLLNTHSRPKIVEYEDCLYFSVKMPYFDSEETLLSSENMVFLLMDSLLISFQEKEGDVFDPVRNRIKIGKRRIRDANTDYLAFCLLDVIVDHYLYIISQLGSQIESLDNELLDHPKEEDLQKIKDLKRELNYLRKLANPMREIIVNLAKIDNDLISEHEIVHYKDLENNIKLANDSLDSYREILSDQLSVYHTYASNRLNDVLKTLTIFSVIFIPITFVAGIYGTNFDYIPELKLQYGYFGMWTLILIIAIIMIIYFKRKRWI